MNFQKKRKKKTQSLRERRTNVKMQVRSVLMETTSAEPDDIPGVEDMIILGKVNDSGKAPPVLVKLKDDKEVSHVLKGAKNFGQVSGAKKGFHFTRPWSGRAKGTASSNAEAKGQNQGFP